METAVLARLDPGTFPARGRKRLQMPAKPLGTGRIPEALEAVTSESNLFGGGSQREVGCIGRQPAPCGTPGGKHYGNASGQRQRQNAGHGRAPAHGQSPAGFAPPAGLRGHPCALTGCNWPSSQKPSAA